MSTGGVTSAGALGVPNIVYASSSGSPILIPNGYGPTTLVTTPASSSRAWEISQYVEQSGAGVVCTGTPTDPKFTVNYTYTPVGSPSSTTVPNTVTVTANTGNGSAGAVLLQVPPQILQAKVNTTITVSVTGGVSGSGCSTQPAYTLFTYLKQLD